MIPIPATLPLLEGVDLSALLQQTSLSPAAQAAAQDGMAIPEFLGALQDAQLGPDAVQTLAGAMPDSSAVSWGAKSCDRVKKGLSPESLKAADAAAKWAASPSADLAAEVATAAAELAPNDPSYWTAQATSWSQGLADGGGAAAGLAPDPSLPGQAVSGAVMLAAEMQASPTMALPAMAAPPVSLTLPAIPEFEAPVLEVAGVPVVPEDLPAPAQLSAPSPLPEGVPDLPPEVLPPLWEKLEPFLAVGLQIAAVAAVPLVAGELQ